MLRRRKGSKGFTLLEVIIVVVIIAVLAAMIIPRFTITRAQAQNSTNSSNWHVSKLVNSLEEFSTGLASTEYGNE
jgi:prepilin-type N-terminal cleavage/methylation domain-containing protein